MLKNIYFGVELAGRFRLGPLAKRLRSIHGRCPRLRYAESYQLSSGSMVPFGTFLSIDQGEQFAEEMKLDQREFAGRVVDFRLTNAYEGAHPSWQQLCKWLRAIGASFGSTRFELRLRPGNYLGLPLWNYEVDRLGWTELRRLAAQESWQAPEWPAEGSQSWHPWTLPGRDFDGLLAAIGVAYSRISLARLLEADQAKREAAEAAELEAQRPELMDELLKRFGRTEDHAD